MIVELTFTLCSLFGMWKNHGESGSFTRLAKGHLGTNTWELHVN